MLLRRAYMRVDPADLGWLREQGLDSVSKVLVHAGDDVSAISHSSDVYRVEVDDPRVRGGCFFVKRYLYPRWSQRIKQTFRGAMLGPSRAKFEFEFLSEMRRRGLPAVRPIAFGEDRVVGFTRTTFLITEGQTDAMSLDAFALRDDGVALQDRKLRSQYAVQLGRAVRRMHRAGVRHGGLFWRNILVRPTDHDETRRVAFLDPDRRGRLFSGPVPKADAVADLAEFTASAIAFGIRGGLSRFLRAYRDTHQLGSADRELKRVVVGRAIPLARAERQRNAVTRIINGLRLRARRERRDTPGVEIRSSDAFFEYLHQHRREGTPQLQTKRLIRFQIREGEAVRRVTDRLLAFDGVGYAPADGSAEHPDLTVAVDCEAWLAIINARSDAFSLIRARGIRISGDTTILAGLLRDVWQ